MLERVQIENFRCLKKVEVPLRPLTVLIGPNDSGKSSFLDALRHLIAVPGADHFDSWRLAGVRHIVVAGQVGNGRLIRHSDSVPTGNMNVKAFQPLAFYLLPSTGVLMQSQGHSDEGDPPIIEANGGNIAGLLDHLLRRDRDRFDAVTLAARKLIDGLEKVEIGTPDASTRRIDVVIDGGFRIPADKTSVGVRLMLFFVALAYHPVPPKLILVEEPENGVHPKRLGDVMRLLREITQGKHGNHAAQVILTTHSPHLLDHVDLDNDQVLVFHRNDDGSRSAVPADAERLKTFLDEFMLGEVWYNEGEAGLVGPRQ